MIKTKINLKAFIVFLLIVIAYVAAFFQVDYLQYYDEILALSSLIYLCFSYKSFSGSKDGINRTVIISYSFLIIIGLLSNVLFSIQKSWQDVLLDMFTLVKTVIIFMALVAYLKKKKRVVILVRYLIPFARFCSYILFVGLLLGLFFSLGTAHYDKWAPVPQLKTFVFFTKYPSLLAVNISTVISILMIDMYNTKNKIAMALCLTCIGFTQAGLGLVSIFMALLMLFLFKRKEKIKWYHIVLLVLGGAIAGATEIREYLLNNTAARSLLFKYSFVTANRYFPLGSGFATYGSAQAAKSYSSLYQLYGFSNRWGMGAGENSFYLNDTYYPMIIGQFGYFGFLAFMFVYYKLFKVFKQIKNNNFKIPLIYLLVLILFANFGNGGITSIPGVLLMSCLGVVYTISQVDDRNEIIKVKVNS